MVVSLVGLQCKKLNLFHGPHSNTQMKKEYSATYNHEVARSEIKQVKGAKYDNIEKYYFRLH